VPSYLKNSDELIKKLKELGRCPINARLFTADAQSMYTNIDTPHAIQVIGQWLDNLKPKLHPTYPLDAVKDAMKIMMTNNIFQFGDAYLKKSSIGGKQYLDYFREPRWLSCYI